MTLIAVITTTASTYTSNIPFSMSDCLFVFHLIVPSGFFYCFFFIVILTTLCLMNLSLRREGHSHIFSQIIQVLISYSGICIQISDSFICQINEPPPKHEHERNMHHEQLVAY